MNVAFPPYITEYEELLKQCFDVMCFFRFIACASFFSSLKFSDIKHHFKTDKRKNKNKKQLLLMAIYFIRQTFFKTDKTAHFP